MLPADQSLWTLHKGNYVFGFSLDVGIKEPKTFHVLRLFSVASHLKMFIVPLAGEGRY